jgi:hypothetical protein
LILLVDLLLCRNWRSGCAFTTLTLMGRTQHGGQHLPQHDRAGPIPAHVDMFRMPESFNPRDDGFVAKFCETQLRLLQSG